MRITALCFLLAITCYALADDTPGQVGEVPRVIQKRFLSRLLPEQNQQGQQPSRRMAAARALIQRIEQRFLMRLMRPMMMAALTPTAAPTAAPSVVG